MPTSSEQKLALYNLAARMLGVKKLTSLTDGSPAQLVFADIYPYSRDSFLCEGIWSFATRRHALVDISEPADTPDAWVTSTAYVLGDTVVQTGVNYACIIAHTSGTFATDLTALKWQRMATSAETLFTEDGMDTVYAEPTDLLKLTFISEVNARYQRESMLINSTAVKVIRSDATGLSIKYTFQNDDLTTYFPLAFQALAGCLAKDAAYNLVESKSMREALRDEYEKILLPRALSGDAQQGSPIEARQDGWESSRISGSSALFPGSGVWHPAQ